MEKIIAFNHNFFAVFLLIFCEIHIFAQLLKKQQYEHRHYQCNFIF